MSAASPHGVSSTFRKTTISTKNFIQPPHFISAAPRPEYSRSFDSSIMASSKWPVGLSTGMRPFSARISMTNATSSRQCEGWKKFDGGFTHRCWTM